MATKKELDELQNRICELVSEVKFTREMVINQLCNAMTDEDVNEILLALSNRVETKELLMKIVRFVAGAAKNA